jgi:replicative DNA helicase
MNDQEFITPPCNQEAERMVLGSILRSNECFDEIAALLNTEAFYWNHHALIFKAMLEIKEQRQPIDAVLLIERIGPDKIKDCGGYDYIYNLWQSEPTGANALYYAELVREKAIARKVILIAQEAIHDAYKGCPSDELVGRIHDECLAISSSSVVGDLHYQREVISETQAEIDRRRSGKHEQLETGITVLDNLLDGLQPGHLVVLGARPSVGKTALALQITVDVARNGSRSHIFSIEQRRLELGFRELASATLINSSTIQNSKQLSGDQIRKIVEACSGLAQLPISYSDRGSQTIRTIQATARRLKLKENLKLAVVDYIQLVESERVGRNETRNEVVGRVTRNLRQMAKDLNVVVLALCQLNRDIEKRGGSKKSANGNDSNTKSNRPGLADLRDSGEIEQHADVVILMHRPQVDDNLQPEETIELLVAKNRNGIRGNCTLKFKKAALKFESDPGDIQ